jgi:exopolysaccharide biosynthesis WecB/TagA/CpsF family protein/uncharacterized protein (TIRG00374 family)
MAATAPHPKAAWFIRWRSFQAFVGLALSILAVILAIQAVNVGDLQSAFHMVSGLWLVLALVSIIVNNIAKAARWRIMLEGQGQTFTTVLLLHLQGQLWNLVYPIRLGDLGRAFWLENKKSTGQNGTAFALGTVVSEKILDIFAYILLAGISLATVPIPFWIDRTSFLVTFGLAISAIVLIVLIWRMKQTNMLQRTLRWKPIGVSGLTKAISSFIQGILVSFVSLPDNEGVKNPQQKVKWGHFVWLIMLTGLIWLMAVLNNYLVLRALGIAIVDQLGARIWDASLLVLVALLAGLSLPGLPLRVGIFEYVCILSLGAFGIGNGPALVFGIILHVLTMLPVILGGLLAGFLGIGRLIPSVFHLKTTLGNSNIQRGWFEANTENHMQDGDEPVTLRRVPIMGITVTAAPMDFILESAITWATEPLQPGHSIQSRFIGYANAHTINTAAKIPAVREYLQKADLVYADGVSVTWAAKFLHRAQAPKMTGRMWVEPLARLASGKKLKLFLLGSEPGVAHEAGRRLLERWSNIEIVGTFDGFFPPSQNATLLEAIRQTKPHILLVGMGSPRQESWLLENKSSLTVPVCWVVGALFDYLAGRERPVPEWMSKVGLEWLWRLTLNPPGKWRRYLFGIPLFTYRVLQQKLRIIFRR